ASSISGSVSDADRIVASRKVCAPLASASAYMTKLRPTMANSVSSETTTRRMTPRRDVTGAGRVRYMVDALFRPGWQAGRPCEGRRAPIEVGPGGKGSLGERGGAAERRYIS